jgi:hypothetical protein
VPAAIPIIAMAKIIAVITVRIPIAAVGIGIETPTIVVGVVVDVTPVVVGIKMAAIIIDLLD